MAQHEGQQRRAELRIPAAQVIRELLELDLFEVSIVPAASNPDTRFVDLKSASPSAGLDHMWQQRLRETEREIEEYAAQAEAKAKVQAKRNRPVTVKTFTVE